MIVLSASRFMRGTRDGWTRVRVQVLNPPAAAGANPTPAVNQTVRFEPVDVDAFQFHGGRGFDEVATDHRGFAETNVQCCRPGVSRLAITCAGHPEEHIDFEVDITTSQGRAHPVGAVAPAGGGQQVMVVRSGSGRHQPPQSQPVIVIIED